MTYILILIRAAIIFLLQQSYKQADSGENEFQYLED